MGKNAKVKAIVIAKFAKLYKTRDFDKNEFCDPDHCDLEKICLLKNIYKKKN